MSTLTRVNGSTYFHDTYGNGSNIWDEFDTELNDLVSTVNALDNANIANTPKIDASKVDLASGGYVLDTGDEITGVLEHIFDGNWRKMRADGNARIYEGTADSIWVLSYNTEYSSGAWQGRDVLGVCLKIVLDSTGFRYYRAVSAASGVVPTWVEYSDVVDGTLLGTHTNGLHGSAEGNHNGTSYVLVGSFNITLRQGRDKTVLKLNLGLKCSPAGATTYGYLRFNSTDYTERNTANSSYVYWDETIDITGLSAGTYSVEVYTKRVGGGTSNYAYGKGTLPGATWQAIDTANYY